MPNPPASSISGHEAEQVERANASGQQPVAFVHGLWLLPASGTAGPSISRRPATRRSRPGWPDDPDTVAEANAKPEVFARKTVGQIADHVGDVISRARPQARGDRPLVRWAA